jgi:hypothetical protein
MIIERAFSIVSATRNILNQFAIRLKNSAIGTGKMHAVGMISQLVAQLHATVSPSSSAIKNRTPSSSRYSPLRRVRGIARSYPG